MSEKLINAAQAVIERWDSPQWNWGEPTAALIHDLRQAVDSARHQGQDEAKAGDVGAAKAPKFLSPENRPIFDRIWSEGAKSVPRMSFSDALNAFANAVRAEERARAAEVVKPFANACQMLDQGFSVAIADLGGNILADDGHFRRAAAYLTDNQGEA